jgi:enamine deaminase RidA (YjgF/YER057c/UK114 family)
MPFELINPTGLEAPVGYSHIAKITGGKIAHIAGQAPFDANGAVVGKGDFVAQFAQVLGNLKRAVEAAGGTPQHYAVLTIYVTDLQNYLNNKKPLGKVYQEVFGKYFPAITLVEVKGLYNPGCMVEISGVAVID